jgi:hypothetical protein
VGHQIKEIIGPNIIPKFQFFQINRERFLGGTMMLDEAFRGPADSADGPIHCSLRKVHLQKPLLKGNFQFKEPDERALHSLFQFVWFSTDAPGAKPLMVFEALYQQVFPGSALDGD